ncbi:unnamed protein product [Lactuca saligna]|uniref:Uncharacterized protein n=1 Tax=Lactuca saligna TaxID=75948 RepID=A0AA36DX64_LACSI|nr:unnamed protein product [Lactuca saligna]
MGKVSRPIVLLYISASRYPISMKAIQASLLSHSDLGFFGSTEPKSFELETFRYYHYKICRLSNEDLTSPPLDDNIRSEDLRITSIAVIYKPYVLLRNKLPFLLNPFFFTTATSSQRSLTVKNFIPITPIRASFEMLKQKMGQVFNKVGRQNSTRFSSELV